MGETIARVVIAAGQRGEVIQPLAIDSRQVEIALPARDFAAFDPRQIEAICSQLWDEETRVKVQSIFMQVLEELKANTVATLSGRIRVLGLGDLAIVFLPGEIFTELGLEIKKRSPFRHTLVVESLGESLGYIPTRKAYVEGGYQPAVGTRVAPGSGEMIVEKSLELLEEVKGNLPRY
jgi:hypothetical protein